MKIFKNEAGHSAVFICLMMPVVIAVLGICIDGSMMLYYKARLMSATKLAAVSATSFYEVEDDNLVIDYSSAYDAAERTLTQNFDAAELTSFYIDDTKANECIVETQYKVKLYFAPVLEVFGFEVSTKTLVESYTAQRNLIDSGDE